MASQRGLSRREVLVLGATGAGAGIALAAGAGAVWRREPHTYPEKGTLPRYDQVLRTACARCPEGCGLLAYVRGTELVGIQGDPDHPGSRGVACLRAVAGMNAVTDPERVLTPMVRNGPRGSGYEMKPVSWKVALGLLADQLGDGKAGTAFFDDGSYEEDAGFTRRFVAAAGFGRSRFRRDAETANGVAARRDVFGLPLAEVRLDGVRTILNFGADPLDGAEGGASLAAKLVSARVDGGARLISFDARLSKTAARSDTWFPAAPGSAGVLALAIAGDRVRAGEYDRAFVEGATGLTHEALLAHLEPYSPLEAERRGSGVAARELGRVLSALGEPGSVVAISGEGATQTARGVETQRCIDFLNIVLGAIDREPGMIPRPPAESWFAPVEPTPPAPHDLRPACLHDALEKSGDVRAYLSYKANPAFADPACDDIAKWIADEKRVPFVAVIDTHLTETARRADLVLPAACGFESWGVQYGNGALTLRRPVAGFLGELPALRQAESRGLKFADIRRLCRPRGKAWPRDEIWIALARRLGTETARFFPFAGLPEYLERACDGGPLFETGGFPALLEHGVHPLPDPGALVPSGFPTASGKIEVGKDKPPPSGTWTQPAANPGSFMLVPYVTAARSPVSGNEKWLCEVAHENPVHLPAGPARAMGIATGDEVIVKSEAGEVRCKAQVVEGLNPSTVALARGFGHSACGRMARAEAFDSPDDDTSLLWWDHAGPGVNAAAVAAHATDPAGGGLAWTGTVVVIEKAT